MILFHLLTRMNSSLAILFWMCYNSRVINVHLPTDAARRIFKRAHGDDLIVDEDGEPSESVAEEVLAQFQVCIVSGVDVAKAIEILMCSVSEEAEEDEISELEEALETIADITIPEGKGLMSQQLLDIATRQSNSSQQSSVKLEAIQVALRLMQGETPSGEDAAGFLIRVSEA